MAAARGLAGWAWQGLVAVTGCNGLMAAMVVMAIEVAALVARWWGWRWWRAGGDCGAGGNTGGGRGSVGGRRPQQLYDSGDGGREWRWCVWHSHLFSSLVEQNGAPSTMVPSIGCGAHHKLDPRRDRLRRCAEVLIRS